MDEFVLWQSFGEEKTRRGLLSGGGEGNGDGDELSSRPLM